MIKTIRTLVAIGLLAVLPLGCERQAPAASAPAVEQAPVQPPASVEQTMPARDLSIDESMGGHTLARHVGKTDAELRDRLKREPQISSASSYTDRATAEKEVAAALAGDTKLKSWQARTGRRPNFVIRSVDRDGHPVGRSLSRGERAAVATDRFLVVLKWDDRKSRFYVLTSYPEAER